MPRVGVIIVTFESRRYFPRLKTALEALDTPYDLVVLDNASSPAQRPTAADLPPHARLVQSEVNLGFAAGNNHAASMLANEFIVLLNPDAFPESDWLRQLIATADAHERAGSIGSTQIAADDTARYDGLGDCYHASGLPWRSGYGQSRDAPPPEGEPFSACAAGALYRATAWREAGGFDESFFCYCEDVDLGFRLRLLGWRCVQSTKAVISHVGGGSSGTRSDFAVMHGTRNRTWTFVKNMPGALLWLLAPAHLAALMLFLIVSPFRGTGGATWRGAGAAIGGLPAVFKQRAQIQRARKAKLSDIAAALTWNPTPMLTRSPNLKKSTL